MINCTCETCQSACHQKPGWFTPGEAEEAAKLKGLGLALPEFFAMYLGVDWWERDSDSPDIFVLAPATRGMTPGQEYPGDPRGACVFLDAGGRCDIYAARPAECRFYDHTRSRRDAQGEHLRIRDTWADSRQIQDLLGREPVAESFTIFDYLRGDS